MAHPRVFLSSTYYDLKNVRVALSAFITQMGYDPILNEVGNIAYGKSDPLDIYCYDEIESSDILISIIGGRYGSSSSDGLSSISQKELKTALDLGKQVYIFIDRSVYSEYFTYKANKDKDILWAHVDNGLVYKFIDELYRLPNNNAIFPFDDSESIISLLKEQWSGLFQRLLQETATANQIALAQELTQGLTTLQQLLSSLTQAPDEARTNSMEAFPFVEHPAFARLKSLLKIRYRIFFLSNSELSDLLKARGLFEVDEDQWDKPDVQEWIENKHKSNTTPHALLKISNCIFDENGNLAQPDAIPWDNDLIRFVTYDPIENRVLD